MNELLQEVLDRLKVFFSDMFLLLWPSIKITLTEAGKYTLQTAYNVVVEIQSTMPEASGKEKFDVAFGKIQSILIAQGIAIGASVINLCIEFAYNKMKETPEEEEEAKKLQDYVVNPPASHPALEP